MLWRWIHLHHARSTSKKAKTQPTRSLPTDEKKKNEKTPEQINALIQLRYNENMQFQQKMHIWKECILEHQKMNEFINEIKIEFVKNRQFIKFLSFYAVLSVEFLGFGSMCRP